MIWLSTDPVLAAGRFCDLTLTIPTQMALDIKNVQFLIRSRTGGTPKYTQREPHPSWQPRVWCAGPFREKLFPSLLVSWVRKEEIHGREF
jgi:hypothetical protein